MHIQWLVQQRLHAGMRLCARCVCMAHLAVTELLLNEVFALYVLRLSKDVEGRVRVRHTATAAL